MGPRCDDLDEGGNVIVADVLAAVEAWKGPIAAMTGGAFLLGMVVMLTLSGLRAPSWSITMVMIGYATLPYALLTRWAWNKPAIRLPNGIVLRRAAARRCTLWGWSLGVVILLWHALTLQTG